jgi:glycosyltransferase involved in cell wall biosynthesis
MRTVLVSYRFPPDTVGGVERYTQSLAAELVTAGHIVTVVARRTEPGRANIRLVCERLQDGASLYRVVGPDIRFDRFLEHHEHFDRLFATALLKSKPDIVHINHIMGFSPRILGIAHRLGAAVVLSLHDFYFACPRIHLRRTSGEVCMGPNFGRECASTCFTQPLAETVWGLRAMYFRRTLGMADAVIAYSDYVASYFRKFLGESKPIHIIPNGVPSELAPAAGVSSNGNDARTLNVAYCGTVASHKGPHVILEALSIARLESVNVLLIGHAPERDYTRKLRNLAATVPGVDLKFYGKYERSELPLLLRGVDCVIVPSLVPEAGPIVPREALACGIPVLAAKLGALPEVIADGENGFTFDPAKPQDLATILRRIVSDSSVLPRLRVGARTSRACTLAEHAEQVCTVYGRALQDFESNSFSSQDAAELQALHENLVRLGCDSSRIENHPKGGLP